MKVKFIFGKEFNEIVVKKILEKLSNGDMSNISSRPMGVIYTTNATS